MDVSWSAYGNNNNDKKNKKNAQAAALRHVAAALSLTSWWLNAEEETLRLLGFGERKERRKGHRKQ